MPGVPASSQLLLLLLFLYSSSTLIVPLILAVSTENNTGPQGPVFISEPPSSVAFANTRGVMIPCTAYGRPAPTMDWIHADGTPVDPIEGIIDILPNNSLHFPAFEDSKLRSDVHAASYRCTATNTAGKVISRKVTVKAVLLTQYRAYSVRVNDVYVTRGNTAVFKCSIDPYFVREYITVTSWTQGATPITTDRFSIMAMGELHVRNIRVEDSYLTYRCITKNVLTGVEKSSDPATLYVMDPVNSAPNIEDTLNNINIKVGETAELPCAASGHPEPLYFWTKDGVSITLDHQRLSQLGGNLLIRNAGVRDSGRYKCSAENRLGKEEATSYLTVTAPLSAFIEPQHQTIDVGKEAVFNCSVYGHPVKRVSWYKDGVLLRSNPRVKMSDEKRLEIVSVQRKDKGMYQCVISNDKENAQGAAQLSLGAAKPILHFTFADEYARPGPKVSLKCVSSGNPAPLFRWTLDGGPLPDDPRFSQGQFFARNGEVVSHVNITAVRVEDGGQYRCQATNNVGTVSHIGRLNVYGVPYIRPMANVTAVANEVLVIRCHVSGYPVQTITWSKGVATLPSNHRQHVSKDGTLTIQAVQRRHDAGEYVCTARNTEEQGMSRSVHVHVMEPPKIDAFRFPKSKQGDRVLVSCVVSSGDLPITIAWNKDGKKIREDLGILIQKQGLYSSTLSIGDADPRHNGNYTCVASNAAASANFTAAFHVDVPPRWVVEPQDSFVVLHKTTMIDCQTVGEPKPTVTWKKAKGDEPGDYQDITFDDLNGESRLKQLANGSLVVSSSMESDHGYYLCQSSNGIGSDLSKVVFLTVHIPTRFEDGQKKNYTVLKGKNATMECTAAGDRPLSLAWSFNGGSLSLQDARLQVSYFNVEKGRGTRLSIKKTERGDSGFYVCNAKNLFGDDAMMVRLTVLEPPDKPIDVNVMISGSRSVTLTWKEPFDGNSPITTYFIQYKNSSEVWQGEIKNLTAEPSFLSASIRDLQPAYSYQVRILANNSIGLSQPSAQVLVETSEEVPSGPPTKVKVMGTGSQSLKVNWEAPLEGQRNGAIIGYYIGYKKYNTTAPYIYVTTRAGDAFNLQHTLKHLEKFTRYAVHVQAFNTEGAGPRSEDVIVLTLEDVPSYPPQGVQATPLSSQSIMVLWSPPPLYTLHGILQGYKVIYKPVREDEDESDAYHVTSSKLTSALYGLDKFTNYSIQVLAYTRMGEGVRSQAIYVATQQDLPEQPADVKALASGPTSVLVTWKPPLHRNGVLTKYILYMAEQQPGQQGEVKTVEVEPTQTSHLVTGLSRNHAFAFWVTAHTIVGEGDATRKVTASPIAQVKARIASFASQIQSPWKHEALMDCQAVGDPKPKLQWKKRGEPIKTDERVRLLTNGSLYITNVLTSDAANYTCRAENMHGADEVTTTLIVQAPPRQPRLTVAATTSTTVQVNWKSGSNGGSKIQGWFVYFKREYEPWRKVSLGPGNRSFTGTNLSCGTIHKFYMRAFNKMGTGIPSNVVTARTNGSAPIMPPHNQLLKHINSTFIVLSMRTWLTGGCPIKFYDIKYQVWGDNQWTTVATHVSAKKSTYTVQDLHPASWYKMKVIAHNDAGATEAELRFSTKTYTGSTVQPIFIVNRKEQEFYQNIYIMVPLCGGLILLIVILVGIILFCRRKHDKLIYKDTTSNLRRDLTAETSLMNDLDKRMNTDFDSREQPYTPEPAHHQQRNVNLLVSEVSDDNIQSEEAPSWVYQDNNTSSDNSCPAESVDSEGNINPYATFRYPHHQVGFLPPREKKGKVNTKAILRSSLNKSSDDVLAMEKKKAQEMDALQQQQQFQDPQDLPAPPAELLLDDEYEPPRYQNQGLILNPRRYASADHIHSLFTGGGKAPQTYITNKAPKTASKTNSGAGDKGGHRHSAISSITTVSSNHDELMQAYENAREGKLSEESMSQPTDSSETTEPGIRQFTQSPPHPRETREAACEIPAYDRDLKRKRPKHIDVSSDTTEYEVPEQLGVSRTRARGRHKGKQKGQVIGKKSLRSPRGPAPPTQSRSSPGSSNSEEITYSFDEGRDPRASSPSEGYLSYPCDSAADSETYGPYAFSRRNARPCSVPVPNYDMTPDTPGTDESKPLVSALAKPALASPKEDDETEGLLDRYYRTVKDERNSSSSEHATEGGPEERKYTDGFTIV